MQTDDKLAYNSVAAWLEGNGILPEAVAAVKGLEENLRLQDKAAQGMGAIPGHPIAVPEARCVAWMHTGVSGFDRGNGLPALVNPR